MRDNTLLLIWLIITIIESFILFVGSIYLVLWRGCSGWWIVLALLLVSSSSVFKVLRKKFNIEED